MARVSRRVRVRVGSEEASGSEAEAEGADVEGVDGDGKRRRRRKQRSTRGPRQGVFVTSGETREAVIGEGAGMCGAAVPSPHPRFKGKGRGRAKKRFSAVSFFLFWGRFDLGFGAIFYSFLFLVGLGWCCC